MLSCVERCRANFHKKCVKCFHWLSYAQSTVSLHFHPVLQHMTSLVLSFRAFKESHAGFSLVKKWFIAAPSIATTMEKRWSNWAFFSFLLMRNIVKSGKRKWDDWTGNQTKIQGCAQRILSHTVMPLTRKYSSLWAYQSRKRYYWSTMLFQRSLITKTGRRNRKAKLVNGSTRNRRNQRLTRDGKCWRYKCSSM